MKSYSINLGGHSFQIRSDADEEHIGLLVDEISERFDSIKKRGPRSGQEFRSMAMVAITLLDELRETSKRHEDLRVRARAFAERLVERIDGILSRDIS